MQTESDRKMGGSLCWRKMQGGWPSGALSIVFANRFVMFNNYGLRVGVYEARYK